MSRLFAAHLLRSIGWDVVVFERSGDDLARRGAGIGASEALFAVMQRIGVPFDSSNGIALKSRVWLEPSGNIAAELPISGGLATAWARLYQALKDALPGQCCGFNRTLTRIEQRGDGVTAIFADGSSANRAAAPSSRLRSGITSARIRQSGAAGRCRFCRSAACRRGSNQGGPRRTMSRRCTRHGGR